MEGTNLPIEDQTETRIEDVNIPTEGRIEPCLEGVNIPIKDPIVPVAISIEHPVEPVETSTQDLIVPIATSREEPMVPVAISREELIVPAAAASREELIEPVVTSLDVAVTTSSEEPIEPVALSREEPTKPVATSREDRKVPVAASIEAKTLVLFGRVGNGKSALGNSIFGKKVFVSRISASGVTTESQMGTATLDNGEVVNVIDTPGLFDSSKGPDSPEFLANQMVKCMTLAKDGIDGIILVCSIKTRFSIEEEGVIQSIGEIFGKKIFDYLIVVFTAGDDLEETFPEYLSKCPPSLQTVLGLCKNRAVLFDNRTKEESMRKDQVQQLMEFIREIRDENEQPYKSEVFERMKKEALGKHDAEPRMTREAQQKQVQHLSVYKEGSSINYMPRQNQSNGGYGSEMVPRTELEKERVQRKKIEQENAMLKYKLNQEERSLQVPETHKFFEFVDEFTRMIGHRQCTIM